MFYDHDILKIRNTPLYEFVFWGTDVEDGTGRSRPVIGVVSSYSSGGICALRHPFLLFPTKPRITQYLRKHYSVSSE